VAESATETVTSAYGKGGMASAVDPEVGFRLVTDSKATCCFYSCARTKEMKQSTRMQAKARDMDERERRPGPGRIRTRIAVGPAAAACHPSSHPRTRAASLDLGLLRLYA
jgi:hypothetical protein